MPDQLPLENDFLNKITEIIDEHISDEHFGVSQLAQEIGMSRSSLHRKVKSSTKTSVILFISHKRLEHALDMLQHTSFTVSEVAYKVGFNSPSYFIKCFRDYYGYTPGEVGAREEDESDLVSEKSIIVLPFENISPEPDQEYFCDGLTEEVIADLSHIHDLLVISRSSAMTFKGTKSTINEIVEKVNVRYVLEGSVRKSGNNIRITAQLIDAKTDSHLWAEKFNGVLEDVFDIQEKVSRSISDALEIKLSSGEKQKIHERPIENAVAYDCYKKAQAEIMSFDKGKLDYGLNLLQKGLEHTGENALIYSGMAMAYFQFANFGLEQEKNINKSEEYINKALALDPDLAEAHFVYGNILMIFKREIRQAIGCFKKALQNKPDHPETLVWLWWWYLFLGKTEASLEMGNNLMKVDPVNLINIYALKAVNHFMKGQFDLAISPFDKLYNLLPDSSMWKLWKALVLLYNNRISEVSEFLSKSIKEPAQDTLASLLVFLKYALKGDKKKLSLLCTPEFIKIIQADSQCSWHLAAFYSYIHETDKSLNWLEKAINGGFINYPFLKNHDILLNNIRGEERFKKLLGKVKYEWENFEV